jgi:hypothetical protein
MSSFHYMYKCELEIYSTYTDKQHKLLILSRLEKVESKFSVAKTELQLYNLPLLKVRPSPL